MDIEILNGLLQLPIMGILIWLLIREQAAKEKLLSEIIDLGRKHAEHLVEMACHGYFNPKDP